MISGSGRSSGEGIGYPLQYSWASLYLRIHLQCGRPGFDPWGWEDPLKEGMATHSNILVWGMLWTEEPGGLQSMGVAKSQMRLSTAEHSKLSFNSSVQRRAEAGY